MSGNHTIAIVLLLLHAELIATVSLEHIVLTEGANIQKKRQTLTSSQFATSMLSINTLLSTAQQSIVSGLLQALTESGLDGNNSGLDFLLVGELSVNHSAGRTAIVTKEVSQHDKCLDWSQYNKRERCFLDSTEDAC